MKIKWNVSALGRKAGQVEDVGETVKIGLKEYKTADVLPSWLKAKACDKVAAKS